MAAGNKKAAKEKRAGPAAGYSPPVRGHAVCSASASKMWINCPPSARLNEMFPNESSPFAEEGSFVHELCEYKVKKHLHRRMKRPQSEEYESEEAEACSDIYLQTIEEFEEQMRSDHGTVMTLVEEKLDFSNVVPQGFGTGDCVLVSPGELHICDYKHGKGVFVDVDHNSQMMLYALGAVRAYDFIYDFQTVSMTIIQPRLENIATCTMSKQELLDWGEKIKPIAKMAFEGTGEQKCGDWCRFCRAKAVCEARKKEALALVNEEFVDLDAGEELLADEPESKPGVSADDSYHPDTDAPVFKQPGLVPMDELEKLLPTLNRISDWIEAVFSYVSTEAIQHGVKIHGYKVVQGRSKRVFSNTDAVVEAAEKAGYTDIYKKQLLTLSEFEKMMGKKKFNEVLGDYVVKPPGKLTLVPESDPREAVETNGSPSEFDDLDGPGSLGDIHSFGGKPKAKPPAPSTQLNKEPVGNQDWDDDTLPFS